MTEEAAVERHIEVTPGIAGTKPRIAGRRVTVANVVIWHEWMGLSADEIVSRYDLTRSEIRAAPAYYFDHRAEIDQSIRDNQAFVEELRELTSSKLPETLRGSQ
jgi:uncharacterized protein (DUF433 family)